MPSVREYKIRMKSAKTIEDVLWLIKNIYWTGQWTPQDSETEIDNIKGDLRDIRYEIGRLEERIEYLRDELSNHKYDGVSHEG